MDAKARIEDTARELGLTMEAEFVPFSKSRNKDEKNPSLNWRVTLHRNGREILTTDYMAGSGHCPAYKSPEHGRPGFMSIERDKAIRIECEEGKRVLTYGYGNPIVPELADVLYSLVADASAIDYATFEDWASEHGYYTDSRSAEKTYRACLETALKLRSAIGDDGLHKLRVACQDY